MPYNVSIRFFYFTNTKNYLFITEAILAKEYNFLNHNIFFEYLDTSINLSVMPSVIGYEKCSANKETIGPIIKTHYIMHYVMSGKGYFNIAGKEYYIGEKTIFILPPDIKLSYKPDKTDPWTYIWVEFNGTSCKQLCESAQIETHCPIFIPNNPDEIFEEFAEIIEQSIKKGFCYTLFCAAKLINIFGLMIQQISKPTKLHLNRYENKIMPVVEYIQQHYCDPDISLNSIAETMFFNPSYLSRTFKKVMNVSPTRYIIELRMRKACEMLKNKAFTVTAISELLGYSNPFYFSLEFKRVIGIAPSKYTEQALE